MKESFKMTASHVVLPPAEASVRTFATMSGRLPDEL